MGVKNTSDGSRNTAWDVLLQGAALAVAPSKVLDTMDVFSNAFMQVSFPSAPATVSINLEGSVDGANWTVLGTTTSTSLSSTYSNGVEFRLLRANVTAFSGGSSPTVTVYVGAQSSPFNNSTAPGTVNANQGSPAAVGNSWFVKVSDGANGPATVAVPTGGSITGTQLDVTTGNVVAGTSLSAVSAGNTAGTTIDFGSAKTVITMMVYSASTTTAGSTALQVSMDGTHWTQVGAAQSYTALDNGTQAVGSEANTVANSTISLGPGNGSFRYARAVTLTAMTGGAVTAIVSGTN